MKVILSNTCVGARVFHNINSAEYNNPFSNTLIVDDIEYINFCNNLYDYIFDYTPELVLPSEHSVYALQSGSKWYKTVADKYPVIKLHTLEVHCIHESNYEHGLDRFTVRLQRLRDSIKNHTRVFACLAYTELINDHKDTQAVIDMFMTPNDVVTKVFLGPSQFKKTNNSNYIVNTDWDNMSMDRDIVHVYTSNNQNYSTDVFTNYFRSID